MRLDVENISSMEEHFDDYMKSVVSLLTGVLFSELEPCRKLANQQPTNFVNEVTNLQPQNGKERKRKDKPSWQQPPTNNEAVFCKRVNMEWTSCWWELKGC